MANKENEKREIRGGVNDAMTVKHLAEELERQEPTVMKLMTTKHIAERIRTPANETLETKPQKPSENKDKAND
jgi:hypothetical protein